MYWDTAFYRCEWCREEYEPGRRYTKSEEWSDEWFCCHECMRKKMKQCGIDIPPLEKKQKEEPKKKWWKIWG